MHNSSHQHVKPLASQQKKLRLGKVRGANYPELHSKVGLAPASKYLFWSVVPLHQLICSSPNPSTLECYCAPGTVMLNKLKRQSLEQRKVYCRATQAEWVAQPPKPEFPEGFQQSIFKSKEGEWLVVANFLVWNPLFLQLST